MKINKNKTSSSYNLRPRKSINYNEKIMFDQMFNKYKTSSNNDLCPYKHFNYNEKNIFNRIYDKNLSNISYNKSPKINTSTINPKNKTSTMNPKNKISTMNPKNKTSNINPKNKTSNINPKNKTSNINSKIKTSTINPKIISQKNRNIRNSKKIITNFNYWSPILNTRNKYTSLKGLYKLVSATKLKNYLINDPCLDWYKYYTEKVNIGRFNVKEYNPSKREEIKLKMNILSENNNKKRNNTSLNILFKCGNLFERKVIDDIRLKYPNMVARTDHHKDIVLNHKDTIKCMNQGVPFIEQAGLYDEDIGIYGVADLIVRSDYLNSLTKFKHLKEEELVKCPKINNNYNYVVIDIKWSTMELCSNGLNIRNHGLYTAYKGQLAIYNVIIGKIQGYIPNKAYIMGKGFKYTKQENKIKFLYEGFSYNDRLGEVDYSSFDNNLIERTKEAIEWIWKVRAEGSNWSCIPPEVAELYPNMCNSRYDSPYHKLKKTHAEYIKEITLLWNVGVKHRQQAHKHGITRYDDPRLTSKLMGITGNRSIVIDGMLEMIKNPNKTIEPNYITNNSYNWQTKSDLDFYVDFETCNTSFVNENNMDIFNRKHQSVQDFIFMIGVSYEENGKLKYICFKTEDTTPESEFNNMKNFIQFIEQKTQEYSQKNNIPKNDCTKRLFHWGSSAETANFNHFNKRHENIFSDWEVTWIDFCRIFQIEPILIKGCMGFGLKEVAKNMYKHGYIKTVWDDDISDGFSAALLACEYYKLKSQYINNKDLNKVMNDIIKYNAVDCKVVWEIVNFFRRYNN